MNNAIYFISDAHIKPLNAPGEAAKQQHLVSFLRWIKSRARALYVVGDLFDFWFEYRTTVPARGGRVLAAMADLVDAGIPVTVFGGNHDWWMGAALEREYGLIVQRGPLHLRTHGLTIHVEHGDGLSQPSRWYNFVRTVIYHPVSIRAFSILHPSLAGLIARGVSDSTRARDRVVSPERQIKPVYRAVCERLFASGVQVAVFGHVHAARIEQFSGGTLVVLGDWTNLGTYGELRDGVFHLRTWRDPSAPEWP